MSVSCHTWLLKVHSRLLLIVSGRLSAFKSKMIVFRGWLIFLSRFCSSFVLFFWNYKMVWRIFHHIVLLLWFICTWSSNIDKLYWILAPEIVSLVFALAMLGSVGLYDTLLDLIYKKHPFASLVSRSANNLVYQLNSSVSSYGY